LAKLVLTHKAASRYDDEPGHRYHFPKTYLGFMKRGAGDFCLYYEPLRGGGRAAYTAMARVSDVTRDPAMPGHYYAWIEEGSYEQFPVAVPFREGEASLLKSDGDINKGQFGRSVRLASDAEFETILKLGFAPVLAPLSNSVATPTWGVAEPAIEFERPIIELVTRRPLRDRAFAHLVRSAYDARCALTGMRMVNGGGASEAEAAHIRPVADRGPDTVLNGLALSRTVHWLFDRGYLSLGDDYSILRASGCPEDVGHILHPSGQAIVPANDADKPHPAFLRWHRENKFKGA
jgi:putative restriction endonuclease